MPSVKRELAARVARATGADFEITELVLRGFYEEMLRVSNESLRGEGGRMMMRGVGRFSAKSSRRGQNLSAGEPHWAFWFRPYQRLVRRCARICAERRG